MASSRLSISVSDSGDEEGGHGLDLAQVVADLRSLLQSGQVGVDHLAVALEDEDQRHVNAGSPSAVTAVIEGSPALVAGILIKHVGPVDDLPQVSWPVPWWLRSPFARSGSTSIETRPSTPFVAA